MRNLIRATGLKVLWLAVAAAGLANEEDQPGNQADPQNRSAPDDLEEVEEVLRVLDEAGVPPSGEELARFLREETGDRSGRGAGSSFPIRGAWSVRAGHYQVEGWDQYGKLTLESSLVRMRARFRRYRTGLRDVSGALELAYGPVEARVGKIGLRHGFGLLVGPPGRGSSLAADAGFSSPAATFRSWLGSPDARALAGFAGGLRFGSWYLRVLGGRQDDKSGLRGPPVGVVQIGTLAKSWRLSGAVLKGDLDAGASLAGGARSGPLSTHIEALVWRAAPSVPPAGAAVVQMGWRFAAGAGIEFQLGSADLPASPRLASRPAVLPQWAGRGFAARGFVPLGGDVRLKALIHLGRHPDRRGIRGREDKTLVEVQAKKRLLPGTDLMVRYRGGARTRWEWSSRYPWQPPRVVANDERAVISCALSADRPQGRFRILLRTFGQAKESGRGRRSLVALTGRRALPKGWSLKGTWVTAWGDPVDLVSAVSPLTGMVLPRHWGQWRSETILGLAWVLRGTRIQAAGSLRTPDRGGEGLPGLTIWLEGGISW